MPIQRILPVTLVPLLIGVLIVAASHSQGPKSGTDIDPVIFNETKGLAVISVVRNDAELKLVLRNNYTKTITAFTISIGDTRYTYEFAYTELVEAGIPPNGNYERGIPFSGPNKPVKIEAVFLEGGAAEGNDMVVQSIRDDRLGGRIQIERTLKLLGNYLDSRRPNGNASIAELKSEIISELESQEAESLAALRKLQPNEPLNKLPEHVQIGLEDGKQQVLRKFQDVSAGQSTNEELLKLKDHYERVLRRF